MNEVYVFTDIIGHKTYVFAYLSTLKSFVVNRLIDLYKVDADKTNDIFNELIRYGIYESPKQNIMFYFVDAEYVKLFEPTD